MSRAWNVWSSAAEAALADAKTALLLDLRRRFKAVVDVLNAMIQGGVTLARSVELTAQWDGILRIGPVHPVSA